MEKENQVPDLAQQKMEANLWPEQMLPAQRNKKLLKWAIRQALSIALAFHFWEKSWMKYALWAWIPLALLNLLLILFFNKMIAWKIKRALRRTN